MTGLSREKVENLKSPLARRVELHEELASTQERARELARESAPHGTLVVSKVQRGGWGRQRRRWESPAGGLWMSLVLRPRLSARFAARVTQAAAVGVAKALREFGVEARIKWPNDLLLDVDGDAGGRKVCGILAEASASHGGALDFVILGVGLNANVDPEDLGVTDREVATLRSELGRDVDLVELLGAILRCLSAELEQIGDFSAILEGWREFDCTLGRRVQVRGLGTVVEGEALDLSPEGALILKTRDGVVEVIEGEIEQLRL